MWTLRDEKYCKNDFWAEVLQNICAKVYPIDKISNQILEEVKDDYIKKAFENIIYAKFSKNYYYEMIILDNKIKKKLNLIN